MTYHESLCQLLVAQCSTCRKTEGEANEKKNPVCLPSRIRGEGKMPWFCFLKN